MLRACCFDTTLLKNKALFDLRRNARYLPFLDYSMVITAVLTAVPTFALFCRGSGQPGIYNIILEQ